MSIHRTLSATHGRNTSSARGTVLDFCLFVMPRRRCTCPQKKACFTRTRGEGYSHFKPGFVGIYGPLFYQLAPPSILSPFNDNELHFDAFRTAFELL